MVGPALNTSLNMIIKEKQLKSFFLKSIIKEIKREKKLASDLIKKRRASNSQTEASYFLILEEIL